MGVGAHRVRCKPRDHHAGCGIDVDRLPVNPSGGVGAVVIVRQPPHGSIAPPREQCVAGARELLLITTTPNVVDDSGRHDLLTVEATVQPHHFAETRHVAQGEVQPSAGEFDAGRVDREVRVLFDAEPGPEALAQQVADPSACRPAEHPSKRVGVHRLVREPLAVRVVLLERLQVLVQRVRTLVAAGRGRKLPARLKSQMDDVSSA